MILTRLYHLARRENLLDDPAFEAMPVPYVFKIDAGGNYLGLEDRRGTITIAPAKKGGAPKQKFGRGKELPTPRPHGNAATQGFARYFIDTLPRVVRFTHDLRDVKNPVERDNELQKRERSRLTFWKQIEQVAQETSDPALLALLAFGRRLATDGALADRVEADCQALNTTPGDRCTFAWAPDLGATILERDPVRAWYRAFFIKLTGARQVAGPRGLCQVTGELGPIPTTHPMRLAGVPNGLPTGVSLVSYDKAAFESYGLDGTANAAIGYEAADGYARALNALIQGKLPAQPKTSIRVQDVLFLFWTRVRQDLTFMTALESAGPAEIAALLESPTKGQENRAVEDPNEFYCLALSGNAARAIVRDYLEAPIPRVKENLSCWFRELTIAGTGKELHGAPTCQFPIWMLALATAFDEVSPNVAPRLMTAALRGDPLPDSILASCLARLRAEGSQAFRPARMALIKLTLLRRKLNVTETLNPSETHPAYVCGRLLEVFEEIQYTALGEVNATVVDKFYGIFSAAPAMVINRLYSNASNHLRKIRGEKPAAHYSLEHRLTEISALLKSPPKGHLSLHDQGWFALGYYHQKASRFAEIAESKLRKAALDSADSSSAP